MFWIYLVIFILMVFTPDIIRHDYPFLGEERVEELVIFVLGATGFLIFLWKERQLRLNIEEKEIIQRKSSLISRDLSDSYSYIGEINRKLEVLKNIALGLPEESTLPASREKEIYDYIMHAVQIFSQSNKVSLSFIDTGSGAVLKEMKNGKKNYCSVNYKDISKQNSNFIETDRFFIVQSPKPIDNTIACLTIVKKVKQHKIKDPALIKTLASQALFLFTASQKIKH